MLWGLVLKPGRVLSRTVEQPFQVTMAALTPSAPDGARVSVFTRRGKVYHLLCTLTAGRVDQQNLSLEFSEGEDVTFELEGEHAVHLTGYHILEPAYDFDSDMGSEESFDSDEEDDEQAFVNSLMGESDSDEDDEDFVPGTIEEIGSDEDEEDSEEEAEKEDESKKRKKAVQEVQPKKKTKQEAETPKSKKEKKAEAKKAKKEAETKEATAKKEAAAKEAKKEAAAKDAKKKAEPKTKTTKGGVVVTELQDGKGTPATNGKYAFIYYRGTLAKNNKEFDKCLSGQPFKFKIGAGDVIPGFDAGVMGMKVGGKRMVKIPPKMGYGNQKIPGIPANSTLNFEITLKNLK